MQLVPGKACPKSFAYVILMNDNIYYNDNENGSDCERRARDGENETNDFKQKETVNYSGHHLYFNALYPANVDTSSYNSEL